MPKEIEDLKTTVRAPISERRVWYKKFYDVIYLRIENPEKVHRQLYQFMPAALEVQETPPSPIGRAIIWLIAIFFACAVLWAFLGRVDIVAVAQGKVIPGDRVKIIQPLEIGTVAQIHVSEGQRVYKGDPLVTLDATLTEADAARLSTQLLDSRLELIRQQVFSLFLEKKFTVLKTLQVYTNKISLESQANYETVKLQHNKRLLAEEAKEFLSRRQVLGSELVKRQAELEGVAALVVKLEKTLPIITERTNAFKKLLGDNLVAKAQYLEWEQQRIGGQQNLLSLLARKRELAAAINEIEFQREALVAESQKNILGVIAESRQKVHGLQQELIKAEQRNRMQILTAPIDGTVQQLVVHTVGGVVTPAQQLMLIVPDQGDIEVEAFLLNKDIGFVKEGQLAEVKIDTFNFTKYGTINAAITNISNDAIQDEQRGLIYLTRVLLDENKIRVNGRWVNLSPGMAVTVEVKTGKRRVIEFFLSPLLRYKQESIRER